MAASRKNRQQRQAEQAHRQAVREAVADEMRRFNNALANGKIAILHTAFGDYFVNSVNADWWYSCRLHREKSDMWTDRSFAGCNDPTWRDLMNQVGEPRHPLFAEEK